MPASRTLDVERKLAPRHPPSGPAGGRVLLVAAGLIASLVALPILAVAGSIVQPPGEALGHLARTLLPEILSNTAWLVLIVALGTTLIGVGTAWLVTACRFPGAGAFQWLLITPHAMPAYIIGYAYTDWLAFAGPVQSGLRSLFGWSHGQYWFPDIHAPWGAGVMLTLVLYPYVFMLARAAFLEQSVAALEAARLLGRGPWNAFWTVALPLARPAIAAGVALALMEALADFGTVQYFGVHTFTTAIYRTWYGMGENVTAAQLSTALLALVLALLIVERSLRGQARHHGVGRRVTPASPVELTGWRAAGAFVVCLLPVILGFALPLAILVSLHASGGDPFLGPRFLRYAGNSVLLAGAGAVIVVVAGIVLAYATRLTGSRLAHGTVRVATLGYAVPGTVIAVGVLIPLGALDNAIDALARTSLGVSTGLVLSGTMVALLFAYLVRFLAVAHGALDAGFSKVSRNVDDVARTLGSSVAAVARHIHLPLMRRPLLVATLLVFVDILKELPATLVVRPFDFDTLAVRVYQLASDERLAQASTGALAIVAVGLLPVILLSRMLAAERRPRPADRLRENASVMK